jgi:hypothetical protein
VLQQVGVQHGLRQIGAQWARLVASRLAPLGLHFPHGQRAVVVLGHGVNARVDEGMAAVRAGHQA